MIRNANQILEDLDKHASEFNFPVLDNAYIEFGAARLSAFQSVRDWLIIFEVLGFSTREIEFVDDLYGFGSCIGREGFVGEKVLLCSWPEQPLFDEETREFIAAWRHWSITLGKDRISFSPSREEYAEAGILINRAPGRGSLKEVELLRFLVHRLGEKRLFLADHELLSHFSECAGLEKFVQTTQWQHPNIAEKEMPSTNISIRSLVEALLQRKPSLFDRGRPNTHWASWMSL